MKGGEGGRERGRPLPHFEGRTEDPQLPPRHWHWRDPHSHPQRNHTTLTRDSHPYIGFTFPRMDTAPKRARATRNSQAGKLTTDHRESHTPSIFMAMVTNHVASASTMSRARAVANKRTPLVCTFREKALLI